MKQVVPTTAIVTAINSGATLSTSWKCGGLSGVLFRTRVWMIRILVGDWQVAVNLTFPASGAKLELQPGRNAMIEGNTVIFADSHDSAGVSIEAKT